MRPLATLERIIERFVERSSARVFHTRVHPLQIQRRIERAMELDRRHDGDRTIVPSRFTVRLHPDDLVAIEPRGAVLVGQLADAALSFARAHRYAVLERPHVTLVANRAVAIGDISVEARFHGAEAPRVAASAAEVWMADADGPGSDARTVPDQTMVFTIPRPEAPLAVLREQRPDGGQREIALDGTPLTIGRSSDNDVPIADSRVSRHHARLQARRGTLVLTDLGSTNGTRVNGFAVNEVVLGPGDRIQVGDTVLLVESVSDH